MVTIRSATTPVIRALGCTDEGLKKDEERARRYEPFLRGQDMIRAFPTEAELHVWLQRLPVDNRKIQYATGIQVVLDKAGLLDGTDGADRSLSFGLLHL